MNEVPALLVIGAHPDECEITAGGMAALTASRGGRVLHVAMTNGDKGHQTLGGAALARIRRDEARAAAGALGAESLVLDNHDGELMPTLEHRYELIRIMREFKPDLVLFQGRVTIIPTTVTRLSWRRTLCTWSASRTYAPFTTVSRRTRWRCT